MSFHCPIRLMQELPSLAHYITFQGLDVLRCVLPALHSVFVGYAESNCVGHTEGFLFKPTPITPCKLVLFSRTEQAVNEIWF